MVDVFIKPCTRLSNDEYNYRESLQVRAIEGIGHWEGKDALHKSCQFFEVAAVPKFGIVSPDKTGFLQREHCFLGKTDGQNRAHSTKSEAAFA